MTLMSHSTAMLARAKAAVPANVVLGRDLVRTRLAKEFLGSAARKLLRLSVTFTFIAESIIARLNNPVC